MGGDRLLSAPRQFCNVEDWRNQSGRPISPPVGEMSGRTEGGAKERGRRMSRPSHPLRFRAGLRRFFRRAAAARASSSAALPTVSAITAPRLPMRLGGPVVESFAV